MAFCKVCAAGEAVVHRVETEILTQRHSYRRVAATVGLSRASLFRHIHRCVERRKTLEAKNHRCPPFFHGTVIWPDGTVVDQGILTSRNDCDHLPSSVQAENLPIVELVVTFEEPVAARTLPAPRAADPPEECEECAVPVAAQDETQPAPPSSKPAKHAPTTFALEPQRDKMTSKIARAMGRFW